MPLGWLRKAGGDLNAGRPGARTAVRPLSLFRKRRLVRRRTAFLGKWRCLGMPYLRIQQIATIVASQKSQFSWTGVSITVCTQPRLEPQCGAHSIPESVDQ